MAPPRTCPGIERIRVPRNFHMYHWNIFNGLIFISALLIQTADAAEIQILSPPGFDVTVVTLKGKIIPGDAERFVSAVENLGKVVVAASGPGGSVNEALEIGATIRQRNFATQVLPDTECYSACALVWISGARRYMSNSSTIGFHAAWTLHNGEMRETGMGNAEIGSFLTHLGLRVRSNSLHNPSSTRQSRTTDSTDCSDIRYRYFRAPIWLRRHNTCAEANRRCFGTSRSTPHLGRCKVLFSIRSKRTEIEG